MSIFLEYDASAGVLIGTVFDPYSTDELIEAIEKVVSSREWPAHTNTVWDFREADVSIVTKHMQETIVEKRKSVVDVRKAARIAFVVRSEVETIIIRMVSEVSRGLPNDMRGFTDLQEAVVWAKEGGRPELESK